MTVKDPKTRRTRDLATIHAMRKELALTEECYRARVRQVSGGVCDSAGALDEAGRSALIAELRRLGAGKDAARRRPRFADSDQLRMIRGLWLELVELGAVEDRTEAGLAAFVKRQTKQEIGRLPLDQAGKVIEALKGWRRRVGESNARTR